MLPKRLLTVGIFLMIVLSGYTQVNLQTGSATFTLPMFNWQDDKSRLKLDVALGYNSGSGLKVNDVASNVGQGWSLVAGGVITRMQVGEPDDQRAHGNATESDISKYPDGFLYAYGNSVYDPGKGCPLALTRYPIYGSKNQLYKEHNNVAADKQLDYFSFQFNGKAGLFVLDPVQGNVGMSLGDSKMKITFETADLTGSNIRTTIKAFTIQDADGLIYHFRNYATTTVLESDFCDKYITKPQAQPNFKSGGIYHQAGFLSSKFVNPLVINSWYLSEIDDPFTNRSITFTYTVPTPVNNTAGADLSYDANQNYVIITHKTSASMVPRLVAINCTDGHQVTFHYDKNRADLAGDKALTAVDVTYTTSGVTRYLSKYQINTSYFILNRYGTPTSAYESRMARLCLRSVKKIGVDLLEDSPLYSFDYYMGSNATEDFVPPPFCVAHDIWGSYNGNNAIGYSNNEQIPPLADIGSLDFNQLKGLCYLNSSTSGVYLNAKSGFGKNGLLKQVIYPTGGTLSYEYAQNTGVLNGVNTMMDGVHVSKTSSTDGGYSNGCANPITTQYNYINSDNSSSLWGYEMPVNSAQSKMHYAAEKKMYHWSPFKCGGSFIGCCYWAYQYPGILSQNQVVDLVGFQKFMEAAEPALGALSAVMTVVDITMVLTGSTGVLSIVAVVLDVISSFVQTALSCTAGSNPKDETSTTYYSYDLNGAAPLPTQFKRVEVVEGSGTNGKTVQSFTSSDDYSIWVPQNPRFLALQRFAPWAYGLPKLTTVYDADGNKVKETENRYDFNNAQSILELYNSHLWPPYGVQTSLVSCKCTVGKSSSQRNPDWENATYYDSNYNRSDVIDPSSGDTILGVDFYGMYSGRTELSATLDRTYKKGDASQYVETEKDYQYNTNNYEVNQILVKKSNGDEYLKDMSYSSDYSGGVFDVMKNNNLLTAPVATTEGVINQTTGLGYTNETVTEYTQTGTGDIKPLRMLEWRVDRPSSKTSFYNGPNNTNYSQYKITEQYTYDGSDNLIAAHDEGNRVIANIYDYNDKYIVASVVNADAPDKAAYTSFETNVLGGWQLSGTASYVTNNSVTGAQVLNLAGLTCSVSSLNTAKPYIVSFWANSAVTVTGNATLVKSAPVINGFTYYEYNIAAGTSTVSISGSALIDELRLYPKAARMRTVTYDPLIGKTSECDENNRITYYEYDNLGRLRFTKDENHNVVKMYEYNNVSKQNGCPGTYYNQQITEYFTKSNCGSGYVGSDVPYTVPANKYSSAISQEDADAQAEMELFTYGQSNADGSSSSNCKMLYYNSVQSQTFQTQNCADGYIGGNVTYTVPANTYSSTDPNEPNQLALDDIAANGQAYANDPAHAVCNLNTQPEWEWTDGAATYCGNVNGQTPAHLFVQATDVNPNSSSYGHTSWQDSGPSPDACPFAWYSTDQSGNYYNQNCPGGPTTGTAYPVSMPPGAYGSDVSIDDANNQARQAAQTDANTNGGCQTITVNIEWFNSSTSWVYVEFQDVNTGAVYATDMGPTNSWNSTTTAGYINVPAGYYNVTFSPSDDNIHSYWLGCDLFKDAIGTYTFGNVLVNPDTMGCNIGIE